MTALPVPPPAAWLQPMTAAEYAALPEDNDHRYELQDGHVIMSASPIPRHQRALIRLVGQLQPQMQEHLELLIEVDLDMELAPPTQPGTVRQPDLVVVTREAYQRVDEEGGFLRADECLLAVEIHSPGTYRTDQAIKHSEYADAGIGHYWMIDLLSGPSLTACHLGGPFGYVNDAPATGTFTTQQPFAAELDLKALV
jgi:Uma2 family endonuclease